MAIAFPPLQRGQCTYASEVRANALHARGLAEEAAKVYLDDHSKK